jgi:hypothetical protein
MHLSSRKIAFQNEEIYKNTAGIVIFHEFPHTTTDCYYDILLYLYQQLLVNKIIF